MRSPVSSFLRTAFYRLALPKETTRTDFLRTCALRIGTAVLFTVSASIFPASASKASIDVYPPNWWVGMESPLVELMLHGDNIANKKVSVNREGVVINAVTALDSPNYLFVTLDITNAKSGELIWKGRVGGKYWASPLYANGHLYCFSQDGKIAVVDADADEFKLVTTSKLSEGFNASPAVAGESLILRTFSNIYRFDGTAN